MSTSRQVKIYTIQTKVSKLTKKKSYVVRWNVGGKESSKSFASSALADNFRTDLKKAVKNGELFDIETGLPESLQPQASGETVFAFAQTYVKAKWPDAAANSRRGILDSLVSVVIALVGHEVGRPEEKHLRAALSSFLTPGAELPSTPEAGNSIRWLEDASIPVKSLADVAVVRSALDAMGKKLDGTAAAAATRRRKRMIFYNLLEYAIELGHLDANPIDRLRVKSRRKKVTEAVDRRVVANPMQMLALLIAVASIGDRIKDRGLRLVAFFACMYFAAMRPGEVAGLREQDCDLPTTGWGRLTLANNETEVGKKWTELGWRHDQRGLKHRADNETRPVPIPEVLVQLLRWHIETFGVAADGRLFQSSKGGVIGATTYTRVWAAARKLGLTPTQVLSPLVKRPYDIRHAALSLWLNSGVPATNVAERAGQSVEVLLRIYAKCIDGDEAIMNKRIETGLGLPLSAYAVAGSADGGTGHFGLPTWENALKIIPGISRDCRQTPAFGGTSLHIRTISRP